MINELPNIFESSQGDENFRAHLAAWKSGVTSGVKFWDTWLEQRGGRWPDEFLSRFPADTPLRLRVDSLPGELVRILDVGSGPVTNIGCPASGQLIEIVAVDPLAFAYNFLLDKHDLNPPLRTIMGFAEDLSSQYDVNSFDYVHCCNALDHSYDPVRGIQEMLLVTKAEGTIILDHAVNEAIKANYDGLHQYNFDIHNTPFIIYNKIAT